MPVNVGQKPEQCPNPDCSSQENFTLRDVRFQHDIRSQIGNLQAQQIPRARITTWVCDSCHSLIEVWQEL
jgi:hypothetical protein